MIVRPNNLKGFKKGLAQEPIQDAFLGLHASTSGEFKMERQKASLVEESSKKKATPLDHATGNRL